jgi:hypothetical protein
VRSSACPASAQADPTGLSMITSNVCCPAYDTADIWQFSEDEVHQIQTVRAVCAVKSNMQLKAARLCLDAFVRAVVGSGLPRMTLFIG